MRILVTGGAGFIGSNIVDVMIAAGHTVAVLDNLSTGREENINPEAASYIGDIRDESCVERTLRSFHPDVVVHHAAQVDVRTSVESPIEDASINILGAISILQASVRHKVHKVIYASSGGAVYGEPSYLPADEQHPVRPISEYGSSKHAVEHYIETYSHNYDLNYTILRYANVYGPRQNVYGEAGVIAIFIGKMLNSERPVIFGDGEAVRDYVYVGDVARANILALTRADRKVVNIGTGVGTSVNNLYRLLARATGHILPPTYAPARLGEIEKTYLDIRYAHDVLAWQPQTDIVTGISNTVKHVRMSERLLLHA